ncbi:hypothetical protein IT403_02070 [Candidatus Nomurabacteria bacterium]|nr:hypothetical protein [Candidatus Nomurabacteria bacterium]
MIQKEHILGVLVGIIAITGVQIATQMQMQRIAQQVEMVQDNISARVIDSLDEEKILDPEDSFTQKELLELDTLMQSVNKIITTSGDFDPPSISLWNRIRRVICRDTHGYWTPAPESDCDWPMVVDQSAPVIQE